MTLMRMTMGLLMWSLNLAVWAQDTRDPTLPPTGAGAASVATSASPLGQEGMSVVLRDGKSLLMVGTRLYATGQSVGAFKIDRITETEVWLRDDTGVRKIPRFAGVQRTTVRTQPTCESVTKPTATPSVATKKRPSRPAKTPAKTGPTTPLSSDIPCEGIQP
jgi:hypothetical protein